LLVAEAESVQRRLSWCRDGQGVHYFKRVPRPFRTVKAEGHKIVNAVLIRKQRFGRSLGVVMFASLFCSLLLPATPTLAQNNPPELVLQTGHSSRVNCAVFGPNHKWLASGGADNTIRIWDVDSGLELRALRGHRNFINSLAVSRNGELLASA